MHFLTQPAPSSSPSQPGECTRCSGPHEANSLTFSSITTSGRTCAIHGMIDHASQRIFQFFSALPLARLKCVHVGESQSRRQRRPCVALSGLTLYTSEMKCEQSG